MRVIKLLRDSSSTKRYFGEEGAKHNVIYFNYEEFKEKVDAGLEVCNHYFTTTEELFDYVSSYPEILKLSMPDTEALNIWLLTNDNYVPDYYDGLNKEIVYLKDYKGNLIPTTGCVIKLARIRKSKFPIYTITCSNGTQGITYYHQGRLPITAAIMPRIGVYVGKIGKAEYKIYNDERKIEKLIKKSVQAVEMKLIYNVLNPISPYFLDLHKAIKKFFRINSNSAIEKYIKSDKFRRLFMEQIKILMPEVSQAIKEAIPPVQIAEYLKKGIEKSLRDETSEELRANIDYVIRLAYETTLTTTNKTVEDVMPLSLAKDESSEKKAIPGKTDTAKKGIAIGEDGMIIDEIDSNGLQDLDDLEDADTIDDDTENYKNELI